MKVEISSAADFLMNLLRVRQQDSLSETQLHSFRGSLITILHEKFRDHWYIENPRKGEHLYIHKMVHKVFILTRLCYVLNTLVYHFLFFYFSLIQMSHFNGNANNISDFLIFNFFGTTSCYEYVIHSTYHQNFAIWHLFLLLL